MPTPSFIDIIDTLSPVVTLGFGIYCAVNDTKPKDGKMSRAGKIALWGLIISGTITLLVKGNSLRVRLAQEEANAIVQEKQRTEKAYADSVNTAFEKATADTLAMSVRELNNIKSASNTTLQSLNVVVDKQQASLENTRKGLNPLFPLKVSLDFTIDMNEYFKKFPTHKNLVYQYLDTLVYFETKATIKDVIFWQKHTLKPIDTINIPKVTLVHPLGYNARIPDNMHELIKNIFTGFFLIKGININLRKMNNSSSHLDLAFNSYEYLVTEVDMDTHLIHVEMEAANPIINSRGYSDDFVSFYDLQNSIIDIALDPSKYKLNQISIFTGYEFSRKTNFKITGEDVKFLQNNKIYTRKIKAEEIK